MPPLRLIFAGSPAAAVPSLERLIASPHDVVAVVTREDTPQGRKRVITPTPVATTAEAHGIPVIKTNRISSVADDLIALQPDLGVIVAYGGLVREPLLNAFPHGWINLHFSILPKWRGAAPVQRAIMAGDTETGASVFRLVDELDAGPVFAEQRTPIGRHQNAGTLLEQLADSGADTLLEVVDALADGTAVATEQTGDATLAPKMVLADGRIDWTLDAEQIAARIRGTTPEPGAFTTHGETRVKVLDASVAHDITGLAPGAVDLRSGQVVVGTGDGAIQLVTVLPAGRRTMEAAAWWRGRSADETAVLS
ncbi:MAG: methionyl-tRNA formyltransferase [Microbacteriaceae bacterium]